MTGLTKTQRDDVEALVADAQRRDRAADRLATRAGQIPVRTREVVRASVDTATRLGQSSQPSRRIRVNLRKKSWTYGESRRREGRREK